MRALRIALGYLNKAAEVLAGSAIILLTLIMFLNQLARNFLGTSFVGADVLATYLMVWSCFLGAAVIVPAFGHVTVDILLRILGTRLLAVRVIALITAFTGSALTLYLALYGFRLAFFIYMTGSVEPTLGITASVLYFPAAVGLGLMCLNYLVLLVATLRGDSSQWEPMVRQVHP